MFLLQTEAMEDQDHSQPMNLEEANDRTLNLVLEGGEDTLRRASAANLKADILFLKHDSSIFRQSFNPVCGSWKSHAQGGI